MDREGGCPGAQGAAWALEPDLAVKRGLCPLGLHLPEKGPLDKYEVLGQVCGTIFTLKTNTCQPRAPEVCQRLFCSVWSQNIEPSLCASCGILAP